MFDVVESTMTVYEVNGVRFESREAAAAAAATAAAEAQIAAFVETRAMKPRAATRMRRELACWEGWKAAQAS